MAVLSPYESLHSIRTIRALLRRWWRLELAFADERGYVIDHADGNIFPSGNEFCRKALFSREGFRRCNESVKAVRDRFRARKQPRVLIHECHLGFDIVAAPIHFGRELVGFLFTGGAHHEEPAPVERGELLRKVREFATTDPDRVDEQIARVPRLSRREIDMLSDLIDLGAREVMRARDERVATGRVKTRDDRGRRFPDIVGTAPAMQEVYGLLEKIVRSHSTVLIHGESGTGKELVARAIHQHGPRANRPFVVQNCSAFNDNLLESALFGHVRGAFTGAVKDQKGLFEMADGGTFFLDEIGDMSPALQVKLLRVLQEGTFTPVGATRPVAVDVRIVAASHKDLAKLVERGLFREDLYYRVNVLRVEMPPMRERVEDLPMLVEHFLRKHFKGEGEPPRPSAETLDAMRRYEWPGNIRELENEIERLMVLGADQTEIGPELLSPRIRESREDSVFERIVPRTSERLGTLRDVLETVEAEVIAQGLIRTHWNKSQLAKELGISRSNLIQKVNAYGLDRRGS